MSLLLLALLAGTTPAQAVGAKVCVRYSVDYDDGDTGAVDDYLRNGTVPARGVHVWITRSSTIAGNGYADDTGADAGCLDGLLLLNGVDYVIHVESEAHINGNTVEVMDNDTGDNYYTATWVWTPTDGVTRTVVTGIDEQWNIMGSAGFAARRLTGGLYGETWRWYNQICPGSGTGGRAPSCIGHYEPDDLWVAFACNHTTACGVYTSSDRKYNVAHQMGHLTSIFNTDGVDSGGTPYFNLIANLDNSSAVTHTPQCPNGSGHSMNSEEYQSQAAYEGMADIWAAMAFNNFSSETDCSFSAFAPVDWDINTDFEDNWFDCGGGNLLVGDGGTTVDGDDYQGDVCGAHSGRATEVDWLRFWWDMVANHGLTDAKIEAIWGGANPYSWFSGDPSDTGTSDPPDRLRSSAVDTGVSGTTWDTAAATNGVDR